MSSSIDNRVVQMTFDNASFERKLDTTIQSIARLEKSLNFEQSRRNIQSLQDTTKNFNLGNIGAHIEGVSAKFLALSTVAVTTLANITTAALRAGTQIVKSLTLEPIMSGYREYETNIGSIQTILANTASKGTQLKDVTAALDELNEYSDKTIYNFSEMTRNIGTFSAAGVDLDTSVMSIKGIANLAAISGSNSQQASTAMYQLSQAIAAGSVKLMDWNSVVNAGMGGEVFQKALFETGKALGTIEGVGIDTTFEQWTKAGNTFRSSLEKGWVTSEVLTTTLKGFTGELTEAQLTSLGYTKEQAAEIQKLGKLGVDSATKVRTLTQLLSTVKESVGSGWSQSFRIIFGDFEEATELFTNVSNAIGAMVEKSSTARNEFFQGWKNLGGRIVLIESLKTAFIALKEIFEPIKRAFQEVFPPMTSQRLFDLTMRLRELVEAARPSEKTVDNLAAIFRGFFSAIKIGIAIIKGVVGLITTLIGSFAGQGTILDFGAKIGVLITKLRVFLLEGGNLQAFFDKLTKFIKNPLPYLEELKDKIFDFFSNLGRFGKVGEVIQKITDKAPSLGVLGNILDRVKQRFDQLRGVVSKLGDIWDAISGRFTKVKDVFKDVFDYIVNWFRELGSKLSDAMKPGDFDAAVDAVNVGLLGGIIYILKKFLDDGLKLDFGGGFMEKISGALDQLTGTLKAMQTNLKAEALQKIAIAIGIITASLLVLSLIDSAALTKALTAMAIGFGQLIGAFAAINAMSSGPRGAAGFAAVATGMILMSTAMVIFAGAVAIFATMEWEEISRGLAGITGGISVMVGAVLLLGNAGGPMVRAGAAIILMSTALIILAQAIQAFGNMSWKEIGKGLTVVAASLLAIGLALALVPATAPLIGLGFVLVATGLVILAQALQEFGKMSWKEIGKSLTVLTASLVAIGLALWLLPPWLPLTAAGLVITAGALILLGEAMREIGSIPGGTIAKSIGAIAAALIVLSVGMLAMTLGVVGAPALMLTAIALGMLFEVIQTIAGVKTGDIVKGVLAIVGVIAALAITSLLLQPAIPVLFLLGAALALVGAAFVLFGAGAFLVAKSIEILAKSGKAGIDVVFKFIDGLLDRLPEIMTAMSKAILQTAQTLLDGAAPIIKSIGVLIGHIIDSLIELTPKFYEWAKVTITNLLKIIKEKGPDIIETGFFILLKFLEGLEKNMDEIVDHAANIVVKFIEGIAKKLPDIVPAAYKFVGAFLEGIAKGIPEIIKSAVRIIEEFLKSVAQNVGRVVTAGTDIIIALVRGLGENARRISAAAAKVMVDFLAALSKDVTKVITAGADFIIKLVQGIGENVWRVTDAVGNVIEAFITEIGNKLQDIIDAGAEIIKNVILGIGKDITDIADAAGDVIVEFINAIDDNIQDIIDAGVDFVVNLMEGVGDSIDPIVDATGQLILDFADSVDKAIDKYYPEFRKAGLRIAWSILDGATFGLLGKAAKFLGGIVDVFKEAKKRVEEEIDSHSPSKVYYKIGENMMMGTALAIENDKSVVRSAVGVSKRTTEAFQKALSLLPENISSIGEYTPTITPVLDLTELKRNAATIPRMFDGTVIDPYFANAGDLSRKITLDRQQSSDAATIEATPATQINFEQNNYSPKELSAKDIYKRTRSQIALAKEELSIL